MIWSGSTYRELQRDVREALTTAVEAREAIRSHAVSCVEHNQRIEAMLREGREAQATRHRENQELISVVDSRVTNLGSRITFLIISFLASTLLLVVTALGTFVAHKIGVL